MPYQPPTLNLEYTTFSNNQNIPSPSAPLLSPSSSPCRVSTRMVYSDPDNIIPEDSQNDFNDFALYLGFDLKKHPTFLHVVLEALKAPLPLGWREIKDDTTDNVYFYNNKLNLSTWEHPLDFYYKEIIKRVIKKSKNCVIQ